MNWVGGARSRLRTKNEKKIQQQFFERKREEKKLGIKHTFDNSIKNHGFAISQDMLSLKTVLKSHDNLLKKRGLSINYTKPRHVEINDHASKSHIHHNVALLCSSPMKQESTLMLESVEDVHPKFQSLFNCVLQKSSKNLIKKSEAFHKLKLQNCNEGNLCDSDDKIRQVTSSQPLGGNRMHHNYPISSSSPRPIGYSSNEKTTYLPQKRRSDDHYFSERIKKTQKENLCSEQNREEWVTQLFQKTENKKNIMNGKSLEQISNMASLEYIPTISLQRRHSSVFQNIETPQVFVSNSQEVSSSIQNNIILSPPKNLISYQSRISRINKETLTGNCLVSPIHLLENKKGDDEESEFYPYKNPGQHSKTASFLYDNHHDFKSTNDTSKTFLTESPDINIQVSTFLDDSSGIKSCKEGVSSSWTSTASSKVGVAQDCEKKFICPSNLNEVIVKLVSKESDLINFTTPEINESSPTSVCEKVTKILDELDQRDAVLYKQHMVIMTALKVQNL